MDEYEVKMLEKIDSGVMLTERELKELCFEYNEVDRIEGDNRRWCRSVKSIIKFGERYFALDWQEGLTECQENEFCSQPYEVEENTYEKTITVTEWKKK
ncbi:MAG: hypothetical protein K0S41_4371 [Anaerocolumna sp.]|jgi:hypothetical protein|nr:hypothetical protein [Anaerocolumna sp.]